MPCCTSASTVTWNGCRARESACPPNAGRTRCSVRCRTSIRSSSTIRGGAQAKRRTQAVIIDHLMPPLTRAESYGPLRDLERLADEFYDASLLDPRRAEQLRGEILVLLRDNRLDREIGLQLSDDPDSWLPQLDAYLCDLKESQIRDGLHVFGESPSGRLRLDTLLALLRVPRGDGKGANAGLLKSLADDLGLGFDPLACDMGEAWQGARPACLEERGGEPWRTLGDTRERLELLALHWIERCLGGESPPATWRASGEVLRGLCEQVAPTLDACGGPRSTGCWQPSKGASYRPVRAARRVAGDSTCCPPDATSSRWTCATCRPRPPGASASSRPTCCSSVTCRNMAITCASSASRCGARRPCAPAATTSPRPWPCSACDRSGRPAASASPISRYSRSPCWTARGST